MKLKYLLERLDEPVSFEKKKQIININYIIKENIIGIANNIYRYYD